MTTPELQQSTAGPRDTHLRDYWKIVWQGRWTIAAVFLVVVAAVTVRTFLQPKVYRATATVEVQPKATVLTPGQDVSGIGAAGYGWFAEEKYHNTQIEIIRSRDVAKTAFGVLGLETREPFSQSEDPVEMLRRMIKVEPRRETGLIEISIEGTDAAAITEWVNMVAHVYVDRNIEQAKNNVRSAVTTIQKQIEPLRDQLRGAEERRVQTLVDQNIFNPEDEEAIIRANLAKYNSELALTQIQIAKLEALLGKIDDLRDEDADPMSLPELSQDDDLQELNRQKVGVERGIESAKVTLRPGHPQYQQKVGELEKIQQRIDARVNLILGRVRNEHALALRDETFLKKQIKDAEVLSFEVGQATAQYDVVRTESETRRRIFDLVTETMQEVQLATNLLTNNVSILDEARIPRQPVRPRKRFNLAVGAMVGLLLGVGLIFFLDYLDNTFRHPDEIESFLKLSVLSSIPRIRDGDIETHAVKEAYQTLRTSVIFSSTHGERKVILVTSAGPQEGKSSTVAQLAAALARAGDRVLVIDCDLRRPTQHNQLKVGREMGLTNFLAAPGETPNWRDFAKKVDGENFQAITCGPIPPNPTELFGTDRFDYLLAESRKDYDWVVLDSPPAASLADTTVLASKADMVVLVVRYNRTDRDLTARVVQQLRNVNAPIAGVVLNDVDIQRASGKDYYYAGYYYASEEDQKRPRRRRSRRGSEEKVETGARA